MSHALKGKSQPNISAAKRRKPTGALASPEARAAADEKRRGRTFLSRGGNGKMTVPQEMIANRMRLPMEWVIPTRAVRGRFESLPDSYKVDLAVPSVRLAIEIDGKTHTTAKWRFLDRRKTAVLRALGWSVLRFWNEEVLTSPGTVAATIACMISRLKARTATSPRAS